MIMKKLKFGIIGCGGIANGKHIPAILQQQDAEISAYCDIIIQRAESANEKYSLGKAKVFADYKQLLEEKLDAVCICTPNNMHCEMTVNALLSGKHVMCEKPMAMNYTETLKMIDARDKSGKLFTIGYQNRYRRDSLLLKKECEKGTLGDIYLGKAIALRRRAVPTWGVFLDEEKQGGGPLIDIGTHALDLTLYMMNNYQPLYAVGTIYHKLNKDTQTANAWGDWDTEKFTVEDSAFGFVVMKNGATIVLESSWALNTLNAREAVCELCGTKAGAEMLTSGKLRFNGVNNNEQYETTYNFASGGVAFYEGKTINDNYLEAKTFIDAILGSGKLIVEPEQAAMITRILEGIYISAKQKKPYYFE
ncbi:MAG: Gfo/Idh/MocA family oxidoreductase [Clostridia bacterium]|nr:Gfo/Idh/MocA family oxidoreductase [Clostridia bacterium]